MAREETFDEAGLQMPDEFKFDCEGHWVDVINTDADAHEAVRVTFATPKDRHVTVVLTLKQAKEIRKELKAATTLVKIAEDY